MSDILDICPEYWTVPYQGSGCRVVTGVKAPLRGSGFRPTAAIFGPKSVTKTRRADARHRKGL